MKSIELKNYLIEQLFVVHDEAFTKKVRKILDGKSEATLLYYLCETQLGKAIGKRVGCRKKAEPSHDEVFSEVENLL